MSGKMIGLTDIPIDSGKIFSSDKTHLEMSEY